MPTYTFKDLETDEVADVHMPYSDLDRFVSENPNMQQVFKFPGMVSDSGRTKPDSGFRDVLKRIKKASGSTNTVETF